jgi:hypothetical protein
VEDMTVLKKGCRLLEDCGFGDCEQIGLEHFEAYRELVLNCLNS